MSVTNITSASAPLAISDSSRIEKRPADVEQFQENLREGRIVAAQRDFIDLALTDAAKKQEQARLAAQVQNTSPEDDSSQQATQPAQSDASKAGTAQPPENVVESQHHAAVTAYMASTSTNQSRSGQEGRVSTNA